MKLTNRMIKIFLQFTLVRLFFVSQIISRMLLSTYAIFYDQISFINIPLIFSIGLINDFITFSFFFPILALLTIIFDRILFLTQTLRVILGFLGFSFILGILTFSTISEVTFWDEFGTKFNFIAVDYLVYTHEIIGTLKESMPYKEILIGFAIFLIGVIYLLRKYLIKVISEFSVKNQMITSLILSFVAIISFLYYQPGYLSISKNRFANEIANNGIYQLFSAFRNNILDYDSLYSRIDYDIALSIVRKNVLQPNQKFLNEYNIERLTTVNDGYSTGGVNNPVALNDMTYNDHDIIYIDKPTKPNTIIIVVESLSAEFMKKFGNEDNITPKLDALADQSLFFTNIYATGTRTVRGLEALSLSVPPTAGSSIIRRPDNANMFTISSILQNHGYDSYFVYGGFSYFDNLKTYFGGNGYQIIDRSDLSSDEISFSNVWGVADEDIFQKSFETMDKSFKEGKPFCSTIMTTSNHRPYSFTEGRIDLPSGSNRNAAVKYTDYAIGDFIEKSKSKPWFDNTIFIITADHCAASAGKINLPVEKYHIPLMIYAPKILKPQMFNQLASQIDILPTVLGLMNIEYKTKFFGTDIINSPSNRAFISTYQLLGYYKDNHLVILSPNSNPELYKVYDDGNQERVAGVGYASLIEEAISFYQIAYNFYINQEMKR